MLYTQYYENSFSIIKRLAVAEVVEEEILCAALYSIMSQILYFQCFNIARKRNILLVRAACTIKYATLQVLKERRKRTTNNEEDDQLTSVVYILSESHLHI